MCVYVRMCVCVCMYLCMCMYMYVCMYVRVLVFSVCVGGGWLFVYVVWLGVMCECVWYGMVSCVGVWACGCV